MAANLQLDAAVLRRSPWGRLSQPLSPPFELVRQPFGIETLIFLAKTNNLAVDFGDLDFLD